MRRILARTAALAVLAALVPGGAWALVHWGRLDLIGRIRWGQVLSRPDDGSLVLAALTVLGWLAWLLLVASIVSETIGLLTRGAVHLALPGARLFAPLAAVLVASIAGLVAVQPDPSPEGGCTGRATAGPQADGPIADRPAASSDAPGASAAGPARDAVHHAVADGDDLWALAERYYGNGEDWRRIVEANRGAVLSPLDRLRPGTVLEIPGPLGGDPGAGGAPPAHRFSHRVEDPAAGEADGTVAVQVDEGDSMWSIAQEELGDGAQWTRIAGLNRRTAPDPALIRPGQVLVVPAERGAAGPSAGSGRPDDRAGEDRTSSQPDGPPAARSGPGGAGDEGAPGGADRDRQQDPHDEGTGRAGVQPLADEQELSEHLRRLVGPIGATTAAVVVAALAARRRWQLNVRPAGLRRPPVGERGIRVGAALAAVASRPGPDALAQSEQAEGADTGPRLLPAVPEPARSGADGPVLVRLGSSAGRPVSIDLLTRGLLTVEAAHADLADGLRASLAIQLSDESAPPVQVRAGPGCAWLSRLDSPRIAAASTGVQLRRDLERLVADRSALLEDSGDAAALRADPQLGEAWEPVVFLLDEPCGLSADELARVGACAVAPPSPGGPADLELAEQWAGIDGRELTPELVMAPARRGIEELFDAADSTDFTKAWWWTSDPDLPDDIVPLHRGIASASSQEPTVPPDLAPCPVPPAPFLRLLGPVELLGARGPRPARAVRQCQEYCAWILANPAGTAARMTRELLVADTTRRSNMSRLRTWLGADEDGEPYLPDAYSGHITLHPQVTSDWEQLQMLITPGVNRVGDAVLERALAMVRGAPLADAAPGEWAWAEQMRSDMVSAIRDIGIELGGRRLDRGEFDQARRAAGTALAAAPDDERLLQVLLRAEHLAGHRPEAERLVLQITRQARATGTDLQEETVALLQEVMEGRKRARLA